MSLRFLSACALVAVFYTAPAIAGQPAPEAELGKCQCRCSASISQDCAQPSAFLAFTALVGIKKEHCQDHNSRESERTTSFYCEGKDGAVCGDGHGSYSCQWDGD